MRNIDLDDFTVIMNEMCCYTAITECSQPIRSLVTQMEESSQSGGTEEPEGYTEETEKLLGIMKSRLDATLLGLVKSYAATKKRCVKNPNKKFESFC